MCVEFNFITPLPMEFCIIHVYAYLQELHSRLKTCGCPSTHSEEKTPHGFMDVDKNMDKTY